MVYRIVNQVITQNQDNLSGPLSDLEHDPFTYSLYSYPFVQNPDYPLTGHNIVFYINIPQGSAWESTTSAPGNIQPQANRGNTNATRFGLRSPTDNGIVSDVVTGIENFVLKNKTTRTTSAISMYIPQTMIWQQNMRYENVSLTEAAGAVGDIASAVQLFETGKFGSAGAALSSVLPDLSKLVKSATGIGGTFGSGLSDAAKGALGIADNPQNFLLFKQIDFRKFQFDFLLTPENSNEASVIQKILYLFRFHSAPEVLTGSGGRFFIPPSQFDIEFLHNGKINTSIPKISTCVCDSVNIDYATSGHWNTTYDGIPIQTRLTLNFTETEIMTKDRISEGY